MGMKGAGSFLVLPCIVLPCVYDSILWYTKVFPHILSVFHNTYHICIVTANIQH